MSQRLHSCVNSAHIDTVQCDSYASKLRRGKFDFPKNPLPTRRERSISRNRTNTITVPPMQPNAVVPAPKSRAASARQPINGSLKGESTATSVIHKELYTDNNALVEVTVKTHNAKHRSRSNSRSSREPWGKLLKQPSRDTFSTFNYFDPLRTLHFLAKELHNKLLESLPNDNAVIQMVFDMQQALLRVPPEIASTVQLNHSHEICPKKGSNTDLKPTRLKSHSKENLNPVPEKVLHVVKPPTCEKGAQTIRNNFAEAEKLQKHLEDSSAKIETACKQMETVCTRLKSEKEELEIMLTAERETVKFLRKQMEDFENEKAEATSATIETLQAEKENLQSQVKKLKAQIETQQGPTSQELRSLIQELRMQKSDADEQVQLLSHQVTLLNMEKEKYVAILSARDRQIKEIRCEMNQLQEVVNEQLIELQNGQSSSLGTSATNMTSEQPSWLLVKTKGDATRNEDPDNTTAMEAHESPLQHLLVKEKLLANREVQGDSSGSSSDARKKRNKKESYKKRSATYKSSSSADNLPDTINFQVHSDTHANIRNMFAEIKKQAMLVTAPIIQPQKMNDIDAYRSEQAVQK